MVAEDVKEAADEFGRDDEEKAPDEKAEEEEGVNELEG